MTDFLTKIFDAVSPFFIGFSPFILPLLILAPFKIFSIMERDFEQNYEAYFERQHIRFMKRQRRAARRRLMRYRRECRRKTKHNVFDRRENAYLVEFMRKE